MKQSNLVILVLIALIASLGVIYYFLRTTPPEEMPTQQNIVVPEQPDKQPIVHYPVPVPAVIPPPPEEDKQPQAEQPAPTALPEKLPPVQQSDESIQQALTGLKIKKILFSLLINENLIQRMVVTIDSLTEKRLPQAHLPLIPPGGRFITSGTTEEPQTSRRNHSRYSNYVKLLEAIDRDLALKIYVHFYSLFQTAYEQLGYKNVYFNDRLVYVLDHLLETPDPPEPMLLAQPSVLYIYADPMLEKHSAGQKILLRIGPQHRAKVKKILSGYRQGLVTLQP